MAALSTVNRLVKPYVRNCPDVILNQWILESARYFCQQTRWLRQSVPVPVLTGIDTYALATTVADAEVTGVYAASYRERPLSPGSPEEYPQTMTYPCVFWFLPSKQIVVRGAPQDDSPNDLLASLLLQPTLTATSFPDELLLRYEMVIADGAIWRLASMNKAGWHDKDLADERMALTRDGIGKARAEADMQFRHTGYFTLTGF